MDVTEEALGTAVGDAHRAPEPQREQTGVHLQADVLARAEGAADTAEHQPHRLDRQVETRGDLRPVLVQPLRGHVQLDALAAGVGHGERRFETEERLVLHADLVGALDDHVAGGRDVAAHDPLVTDHVAVGMDRRMAAVDRSFRVEQRVEHLVLDDDRLERPAAGLGMVGSDGSDRFADVAHDVGGEHRLVLGDQAVVHRAGHVGSGDHGLDAVDLPGGARRRSTRCGRAGAASAAWRPRGSHRRTGRTRTRSAPAPWQRRRAAVGDVPIVPGRADSVGRGDPLDDAHDRVTLPRAPRPVARRR